MYPNLQKNKHQLILFSYYLVLGILASLALGTLNLNSYCIVLLFLCTLLRGNVKNSLVVAWREPFFRACTLLFIIYFAGTFYSADWIEGIRDVEKRLALVVIPFILCSKRFTNEWKWQRIMLVFTLILLTLSVICVGLACYRFMVTGQVENFFYHDLVKPLAHHAIYFSLLVFICIVYLIERNTMAAYLKNLHLLYLMVGFFILFLILLSSKLILIFLILYLFYKILRSEKLRIKWYVYVIGLCISMALVFFVDNPVKRRFEDITTIDKEKFISKDLSRYYFNGLEFRLMQYKLVMEILQENNRWIAGVSPADAQKALNAKYKQYSFYMGEAARGDQGFIDYNAHNQFLQCLLQSGLLGLLAFVYVCYTLIRLALRIDSAELRIGSLLIVALCFTESLLQTQRGIVSFTLFPLLIAYTSDNKGAGAESPDNY